MRVLVVKSPFKDYRKGEVINDEDAISEILKSEQKVHVVASFHHETTPSPKKAATK